MGRPLINTASQNAMKKARGYANKPIPGPEIRFDRIYHILYSIVRNAIITYVLLRIKIASLIFIQNKK